MLRRGLVALREELRLRCAMSSACRAQRRCRAATMRRTKQDQLTAQLTASKASPAPAPKLLPMNLALASGIDVNSPDISAVHIAARTP